MLSDSFRYNALTCSLKTSILRFVPPNDVSCSSSGFQVDLPPGVNGVGGILPPVSSGCESVLSYSRHQRLPFFITP